jgi:hypothetical protein
VASRSAPVYQEMKASLHIPEKLSTKAQFDALFTEAILQKKERYNKLMAKCKVQKPELYEKLVASPLFGDIRHINGEFGFWMAGDAVIASMLSQKHGLNDLVVCETIEAFAEQFSSLCAGQWEGRRAFIIPTTGSNWGMNKNFPQHQIPVLVEKTKEGINVAILDSQPSQEINSTNVIGQPIWAGFPGSIPGPSCNHIEFTCRALLQAKRDIPMKIFIPTMTREFAGGCIMFALHDAVSFLRRKNFFTFVEGHSQRFSVDTQNGYELYRATVLPPENMVGTQSGTVLAKYELEHPALGTEVFPGKKHEKTLVQTRASHKWSEVEGKRQNNRITLKLCKYTDAVLDALSSVIEGKMTEEAFLTIQKRCFAVSNSAHPPV